MRIRWLRKALQNLDAELEFIAQEDQDLAHKIYLHLMERIETLKEFPNHGRNGRVFGTRELVIERYPYIIPYRVRENTVEILRVFHTSRKLPEKW
ncbi:type II toxin-antitoxin system RelE/ParE family toxin [Solidesulfovibrio alcoholivorans]|uniref:type II toxin-antitoxin system RelE/ParE family toxin n=1 Tax=Solidesulfovibrio alcoholivorans TaxID=81406 RepID=UPI00069504D7|nr:type II toxin-antitoxin system RelE/ParE family toxin [Solidesulfovibrio alcoholivorans]